MTLKEAAQRLGLSASTLRNQAKAGRLAATRIGPLFWVEEAEVERYRVEQQGKPGRKR